MPEARAQSVAGSDNSVGVSGGIALTLSRPQRGTRRATLLADMRRFSRRGWLIGLSLAATACLSPTLPLPPPSKPVVEGPDQQGMVTLDGYVEGEATVFAANPRTGEIRGQFTGPDGHYRFAIAAVVGDELELWYQVGTTTSPGIVFKVPK